MRFLKLFFTFFVLIFAACNVSSKSKTTTTVVNTEAAKTKTAVKEKAPTGIEFIEQDWSAALQQAKKQNKLVFLDIYATWCGPCKMLKQFTFSDTSVGRFFNNNFVNISVDGEKGVGPQLAQQYSIEGYPSLIITDTEGKPVLFTAGYMPVADLLRFANEALKRSNEQVKM
jgi:thiol:disulfide interchange protein